MRSIGILSLASAILLAGCGGGGGSTGGTSTGGSSSGGSSSSTPVTVQMQSAMQKFAQSSSALNFTVSGWIEQNGQQVNVSGSGVVNTSPAQSNGTYTETINGTVNGTSFNSTLNLAVPYSSAPTTVTAGQTGSFGNVTYSVAADGANALLVTVNVTSAAGTVQNQVQAIYKIDTAGNVTPVSLQDQASSSGTEVLDLTLTF